MSTKTQLQTITDNDLHNLELLKKLFDFGKSFKNHAKSVNDLFYFYIQNCVNRGDEIFLEQSDVYNVFEIVNILQSFKNPTE